MSSRYSVTVEVKDGGLLSKLDNLQRNGLVVGGPSGSGGGGGATATGGGFFSKMESLGVGQIAKLTGITLGIGSLVALTMKSSAILEGTAKLWERSIMLIFKPIGDFVGMALRPVTLALLTQLIIPFYKSVYPFFRDYGTKVGEALSNPLKHINDRTQETTVKPVFDAIVGAGLAFAKLAMDWNNFVTDIQSKLNNIPSFLMEVFTNFGTTLWDWLSNVPSVIFGVFANLGTQIASWLANVPNVIFGVFATVGMQISSFLMDVPTMLLNVFTSLASGIGSALADIPSMIRNAILAILDAINPFNNTGGTVSGGAAIARTRGSNTRVAAIADTL